MNGTIGEALARGVCTLQDRRGWLKSAGAMALLGLADTSQAAGAKKNGGNGGKQSGNPDKKRCKRQVEQCRTVITSLCAGIPDCIDALICCDEFEKCQADDALSCIFPPQPA
jgi:hypothetical protein